MAKPLSNGEAKQIARRVHADVATLDAMDELDLADIQDMSIAELESYLAEHGAAVELDRIEAEVRAQLGAGVHALENGRSLDAAKQADMEKRVERAVRTAAAQVAKGVMGSIRSGVFDVADERADEARLYVWFAKLRNSCRSCEELHGEVKPMDAWEDIGVPRAGTTLCGGNCECDLVPVAGSHALTRSRVDEINRVGPRRSALAQVRGP